MRRFFVRTALAVLCLLGPIVQAHMLPLSQVELRADDRGLEARIEAPAVDFAHDLPDVTPDILLTPAGADGHKDELFAILATRLILEADGQTLKPALREIKPMAEQKMVRLRLRYLWSKPPDLLRVHCRLFPYDPRHQTFLNIYRDDRLARQLIFDQTTAQLDEIASARQDTLTVVRQFLVEGVHHIFIGPDHILFVVGLLLLGGTVKQLLKIVTAFTLAHSVTLVLATLDILTPPARVIEPAIALSIVFVGVHALVQGDGRRDWRLLFAFGFGFIHGFGFAYVLREMELPRAALGWSLLSFNVGVEIGQACIVLAVAPMLVFVHRRSAVVAGSVVTASSFCVIAAGSFWFVQRLFPML